MEKLKVLYEALKHVLGFVSKLTPILDKGVDGVADSVKELEEKKAALKKQIDKMLDDSKQAWTDKD
jgi:archaellum component FlaC